jgi:hypothetical protein
VRYVAQGIAVVVLAGVSMAPVAEAVGGGKAVYVGGTISGIKEKTEGPINLKGEQRLLFNNGTLEIPWSAIEDVEYGQKVGHRVATAILLSPIALFKKARHHYVTVAYKDAARKDQAVVFEFDKDDIRMALATFKARTGKEITYQDDEARKQMGGGVKEEKKK